MTLSIVLQRKSVSVKNGNIVGQAAESYKYCDVKLKMFRIQS